MIFVGIWLICDTFGGSPRCQRRAKFVSSPFRSSITCPQRISKRLHTTLEKKTAIVELVVQHRNLLLSPRPRFLRCWRSTPRTDRFSRKPRRLPQQMTLASVIIVEIASSDASVRIRIGSATCTCQSTWRHWIANGGQGLMRPGTSTTVYRCPIHCVIVWVFRKRRSYCDR